MKSIDQAELRGIADFSHGRILINGKSIASFKEFDPPFQMDATSFLKKGRNVLRIEAKSLEGPAAIALRLRIQSGKSTQTLITDRTWRGATDFGILADEPWGEHPDSIHINPLDDYEQWRQATGAKKSADPSRFFVRDGFQIELLHSATKKQGSWVSMAFDPKGRLVIGRENKGLLRFTLPSMKVETINDTVSECRGLLFAHGALYANANKSYALYRLRDTNGDDQFDEVKLLLKTGGTRGHGRNDLALGPDGRIYAIHGDAVDVPTNARNWRSPFVKHSRKGKRGFVLRTDRDGKKWDLITTGLRNPYGIDFNRDGEMFTYDADAEYDSGSSWYRPTRVHHLLPGGDYGWRAVTRAWPPYDPDVAEAAPPTFDIGKGSPTAVKFGTKSRFPPKYRRALFALDWAYGRILAIHMTPRGASYAMRAETFLKGRPLNVTDLDFGPDGAMYVITGGRSTQSGLYRIKYVGKPVKDATPSKQQVRREKWSKSRRKLRRELESFIVKGGEVNRIWPHLGSRDPALRHAARIALEHQPIKKWRAKALAEDDSSIALTALLSLAQSREKRDHAAILARLNRFSFDKLSIVQQKTALRIYELILDGNEKTILKRLDPLYPTPHFAVNQPLSLLLSRLNALNLVTRTMRLLERASTQREQFHCIYLLRNVKQGWNEKQHLRYFAWIRRMQTFVGGEGMPTFIKKIESESLARLNAKETALVAPLLKKRATVVEIPEEAKNRKHVRDWKEEDLLDSLASVSRGRSFERGLKMFRAATCIACHRMNQSGAAIGPDLTSVAARFSRRDILLSILQPDKVVAEQYRRDVIETSDGRTHLGMILQGRDYRSSKLTLLPDPMKPEKTVSIDKKTIESHSKAKTSIMPQGLINSLTREEILDMLAFLEWGGNLEYNMYG